MLKPTVLISVIVPVYNVGNLLKACVASIVAQTYTNFELILVNDGSTDDSGALCDSLAAEDPRIHVLHKENGGVSSARNAGLSFASGQYIAFVDADDYIHSNYLDTLYCDAVQFSADIVCCNCTAVNPDGTPVNLGIDRVKHSRLVCDKNTILWDNVKNEEGYTYACWGALFRADLVKPLKFRPFYFGEDHLFTLEALLASERVYLRNYPGYYYVQWSGSVSHTSYSPKRSFTHMQTERICYDLLENISEELRDIYYQNLAAQIHETAYCTIRISECSERKQYRRVIREHLLHCTPFRNCLSRRLRINLELLLRAPGIYYLSAQLNEAAHNAIAHFRKAFSKK